MKRVVVPELLDSDSGTAEEIADSLSDLRMVNRRFGGVRTVYKLLREVAVQRKLSSLSCLDVAGASGDIMEQAAKALAGEGVQLDSLVLDRAATHLNGGRAVVRGDALMLPFLDNSFDVVSCSLFVHHLEPGDVMRFAREAMRVARHALIISDLRRNPVHLALVYFGFPLYRSRLTRHDAPASVRRAYTAEEVERLLRLECEAVEVHKFYLFRMGVIAWKEPTTT